MNVLYCVNYWTRFSGIVVKYISQNGKEEMYLRWLYNYYRYHRACEQVLRSRSRYGTVLYQETCDRIPSKTFPDDKMFKRAASTTQASSIFVNFQEIKMTIYHWLSIIVTIMWLLRVCYMDRRDLYQMTYQWRSWFLGKYTELKGREQCVCNVRDT